MKKLQIILLILNFCSISCSAQKHKLKNAPYNIEHEGDGLDFNYDTFPAKYIQKAKQALKKYNFKFPNNQHFKNRIKEVFKFRIGEYKNKIIALRRSMFPEIVIKENKFILVEDPDYDDKEDLNIELLYHYNSYIFYKDRISYNWLKQKDSFLLKDLVTEFGYTGDTDLVKYVFKKIDFNSVTVFHDLIFGTINRSIGKYAIRGNVFDCIERFMYKEKRENGYSKIYDIEKTIRNVPNDYVAPDKTIAYLYERALRAGIVEYIQRRLNEEPTYKSFLEKNNYFGYVRLKNYVRKKSKKNAAQ